MPGDYLFQRRKWVDSDIPDVDEMNQDLQDPAARLGGRLNQHNIDATPGFSPTDMEDNATQEWFTAGRTVDHGLRHNVDPPAAMVNSQTLVYDGEWQVLNDCTISTVVGEGKVDVRAFVCWCCFPYAQESIGTGFATYPRPQFAIRINGVVYEEASNAAVDRSSTPPVPVRIISPADHEGSKNAVGVCTLRSARAFWEGNTFAHTRLSWSVPVPPGDLLIDLVARVDAALEPFRAVLSGDASVVVSTRMLLARFIPVLPQETRGSAGVVVPVLRGEDVLSTAAHATDRILELRTQSNAVTSPMMGRRSLNHNHLPSSVIDKKYVDLPMGNAREARTEYPVYLDTFTSNRFGGLGAGWYIIDDGAGNELKTTGTLETSTAGSFILILADVGLTDVRNGTGLGSGTAPTEVAFFAIAYQRSDTGAWEAIDASHAPTLAGPKILTGGALDEQFPVERNAALLAWIDLRSAGLAYDITSIAVVSSSADHSTLTVPTIKWRDAALTVLQFGKY